MGSLIIQQYKIVTCPLLDKTKPRAVLKNKNYSDDGTSNLDNRLYFYTQLLNPYRLIGAQETILATSDCELRKYLKCLYPYPSSITGRTFVLFYIFADPFIRMTFFSPLQSNALLLPHLIGL